MWYPIFSSFQQSSKAQASFSLCSPPSSPPHQRKHLTLWWPWTWVAMTTSVRCWAGVIREKQRAKQGKSHSLFCSSICLFESLILWHIHLMWYDFRKFHQCKQDLVDNLVDNLAAMTSPFPFSTALSLCKTVWTPGQMGPNVCWFGLLCWNHLRHLLASLHLWHQSQEGKVGE